jgi:hypothetical protein
LTRTSSERPFWRFVTRTTLGSGRVGCAALIASLSKTSPFAVSRPSNASPYQDATPTRS